MRAAVELIVESREKLKANRDLVGASRFERPTSRTPSECANQAALRSDYD